MIAGRSRTQAVSPQGWHGRGMASVNQTRPHCVNQMGKTHSKPLVARHVMCESAYTLPSEVADI